MCRIAICCGHLTILKNHEFPRRLGEPGEQGTRGLADLPKTSAPFCKNTMKPLILILAMAGACFAQDTRYHTTESDPRVELKQIQDEVARQRREIQKLRFDQEVEEMRRLQREAAERAAAQRQW